MYPLACNLPAASVTPARRTPSIEERNSCVTRKVWECARSAVMSSHRARRCSTTWNPVTARGLRELGHEDAGVAANRGAQCRAECHLLLECARRQAQRVARSLDQCPHFGHTGVEGQRPPEHAFAPGERHLDLVSIDRP